MVDVIATPSGVNTLGRLGENEHTRMLFEISDYLTQYPGASFELLNQRPGDSLAYLVSQTQTDEQYLYWVVTSPDLTQSGVGYCEFVVKLNGVVVKSVIYMTEVLPALDGSGDAPGPWESWLTRFEEIAAQASSSASASADSAQESANSAQAAADSAAEAAQYGARVSVSGTGLVIATNNG